LECDQSLIDQPEKRMKRMKAWNRGAGAGHPSKSVMKRLAVQAGVKLADGRTFDYLTLRHGRYGGVDVLGWGTYSDSSVLAGQPMKVFIDNFPTEDEAHAKYPQAERFSNAWTDPAPSLNHLPGPDDMVPGGALPDDIGA
jgi:hypothetical protein